MGPRDKAILITVVGSSVALMVAGYDPWLAFYFWAIIGALMFFVHVGTGGTGGV